MKALRLDSRLRAIERQVPAHCPACAARPLLDRMLFRYQGVLQTHLGVPVDESVLEPCPACGKGGAEKVMDGVNAGAMLGHGIRVIAGVDPASI